MSMIERKGEGWGERKGEGGGRERMRESTLYMCEYAKNFTEENFCQCGKGHYIVHVGTQYIVHVHVIIDISTYMYMYHFLRVDQCMMRVHVCICIIESVDSISRLYK